VNECGCRRLLLAVIDQAIDEARGRGVNREGVLEARAWLQEEGGTFDRYAQLLGMNPGRARLFVHRRLQLQGPAWLRGPREGTPLA
jgi:hypothetical protein